MRYLIFACALAMSQLAAHAEGRAWLGLTIGDVTSNEEVLKLGWSSGVPVLEVHAGSPASSAGIRAGDIIVDLDGEHVINANELICRVAKRTPGAPARITTVRGTEIRHALLVLANWPNDIFDIGLQCPPDVG